MQTISWEKLILFFKHFSESMYAKFQGKTTTLSEVKAPRMN